MGSHAYFGAVSGWGKSWFLQQYIAHNADRYDMALVWDWTDEYRGLVADGDFQRWIVGPQELQWTTDTWAELLAKNPKLVLVRHEQLIAEEWREAVARGTTVARELGDSLVAVDEAHFVSPQQATMPDALRRIVTAGRGQGHATMWASQRTARVDQDVITQASEWVLGGLREGRDRLREVGLGYDVSVHNPSGDPIQNAAEGIRRSSDESTTPPLKRWTGDREQTTGSEWIRSDLGGGVERVSTRELDSLVTHYGQAGNSISHPSEA